MAAVGVLSIKGRALYILSSNLTREAKATDNGATRRAEPVSGTVTVALEDDISAIFDAVAGAVGKRTVCKLTWGAIVASVVIVGSHGAADGRMTLEVLEASAAAALMPGKAEHTVNVQITPTAPKDIEAFKRAVETDLRRVLAAAEQEMPETEEAAWRTKADEVVRMIESGVPSPRARATQEMQDLHGAAAQRAVTELAARHFPDMPAPSVSFSRPQAYATVEDIHAMRVAESEETGVVCEGCGAKERRQKLGPIATTMLHRDDCPKVRDVEQWEANRQRDRSLFDRLKAEAPFVALVNAVPEWADPNAWRAAVLAVAEMFPSQTDHLARDLQWLEGDARRESLGPVVATSMRAVAWSAYRRALAPHSKVAPERKGATWKSRGPALPCDNGEDD